MNGTKPLFPIYIPSKGRAGDSKILTELNTKAKKMKHLVFVEKEEYPAYKKTFPKLEYVVLQKSNQGLSYVRNVMRERAVRDKEFWYWSIDDDVTLWEYINGKAKKISLEDLAKAEPYFYNQKDIGQAGLNYKQFAWSAKKQYRYYSYCDCVVCNRVELFKYLQFDETLKLKIDRDMTLQVLSNGYKSMLIDRFAFDTPANGTNAGGLDDTYKSGIEEEMSKRMVAKWGDSICTFNRKKDGRPDVKINWKFFKKIYQT